MCSNLATIVLQCALVLCCDIPKGLVLKLVVSSHQAASTSWLVMPNVGVVICIVVVICQLHVQQLEVTTAVIIIILYTVMDILTTDPIAVLCSILLMDSALSSSTVANLERMHTLDYG